MEYIVSFCVLKYENFVCCINENKKNLSQCVLVFIEIHNKVVYIKMTQAQAHTHSETYSKCRWSLMKIYFNEFIVSFCVLNCEVFLCVGLLEMKEHVPQCVLAIGEIHNKIVCVKMTQAYAHTHTQRHT